MEDWDVCFVLLFTLKCISLGRYVAVRYTPPEYILAPQQKTDSNSEGATEVNLICDHQFKCVSRFRRNQGRAVEPGASVSPALGLRGSQQELFPELERKSHLRGIAPLGREIQSDGRHMGQGMNTLTSLFSHLPASCCSCPLSKPIPSGLIGCSAPRELRAQDTGQSRWRWRADPQGQIGNTQQSPELRFHFGNSWS